MQVTVETVDVGPQHVVVNGVGVEPDVVVPETAADFAAGLDPQLDRAVSDLDANSLRNPRLLAQAGLYSVPGSFLAVLFGPNDKLKEESRGSRCLLTERMSSMTALDSTHGGRS